MRLDIENDLAVRSLVALAVLNKRVSIAQIAQLYKLPRHMFQRCSMLLNNLELISTSRGYEGGIELKVPAERIKLSQIVQAIEPAFNLAPCMDGQSCEILLNCQHRNALLRGLQAFMNEIDKTTIADIANQPFTRRAIITAARELGIVD